MLRTLLDTSLLGGCESYLPFVVPFSGEYGALLGKYVDNGKDRKPDSTVPLVHHFDHFLF